MFVVKLHAEKLEHHIFHRASVTFSPMSPTPNGFSFTFSSCHLFRLLPILSFSSAIYLIVIFQRCFYLPEDDAVYMNNHLDEGRQELFLPHHFIKQCMYLCERDFTLHQWLNIDQIMGDIDMIMTVIELNLKYLLAMERLLFICWQTIIYLQASINQHNLQNLAADSAHLQVCKNFWPDLLFVHSFGINYSVKDPPEGPQMVHLNLLGLMERFW
jgi:hypothetical protein